MLESPHRETRRQARPAEPFEAVEGDIAGGLILICDHARPDLPTEYGTLGLAPGELARHIAYDIGARAVTVALARRLGVPAVLSRYSRLLIDPNRGTDDPTLVMRIADGSIVPGNARIDEAEIARRIRDYHGPYHDAIDALIDQAIEARRPPAILSIHSFTPRFHGAERPWHATILWDRDPRLAVPLIGAMEAEPGLVTGENVPYTGQLRGDTLYRHGTGRGLAHALIEIRQDLIADEEGQAGWAERLERVIGRARTEPRLNQIVQFGSVTDRPAR